MTKKTDWKQELFDSTKFKKKQEKLLKSRAKSLTKVEDEDKCQS